MPVLNLYSKYGFSFFTTTYFPLMIPPSRTVDLGTQLYAWAEVSCLRKQHRDKRKTNNLVVKLLDKGENCLL